MERVMFLMDLRDLVTGYSGPWARGLDPGGKKEGLEA